MVEGWTPKGKPCPADMDPSACGFGTGAVPMSEL